MLGKCFTSPDAWLLVSPQPTWVLIMAVPDKSPFIFRTLPPGGVINRAYPTGAEMGSTERQSRNHGVTSLSPIGDM